MNANQKANKIIRTAALVRAAKTLADEEMLPPSDNYRKTVITIRCIAVAVVVLGLMLAAGAPGLTNLPWFIAGGAIGGGIWFLGEKLDSWANTPKAPRAQQVHRVRKN